MATLEEILKILGPLVSQIGGLIQTAIAAHTARDQAALDAAHAQARAAADALKPAGQ